MRRTGDLANTITSTTTQCNNNYNIKKERWRESNIFIAYGWSVGLQIAFVTYYSMASFTMFSVSPYKII